MRRTMKTLLCLLLLQPLFTHTYASCLSPADRQRRRRHAHATKYSFSRAPFETKKRGNAPDDGDDDPADLSNKNIPPLMIEGLFGRFRGGSSSGSSTTSSALLVGLKNSLASGLAAACSKTILAPFDTLKTAQQYMKSAGKSPSLLETTRIIINRPKGVLELYAGLGVAVVGSMPSVGLYFGVYSYCKKLFYPWLVKRQGNTNRNNEKFLWMVSIATSAAIGNTVASFSRVPYEVVKQKLQTGLYSTTWEALSDMARNQGGLLAFFPAGGVSIQMIRDIPYAIVTLLSYEYLKEHYVKPYKQRNNSTAQWCDMVAGAVAGGIGSYVTNPADVVKTRLQTNPELYGGSIWKCTSLTFQEGGAMAFLRGSVPRLLHKVPANGFFFLFYEVFRKILQVESHEESDESQAVSKR